MSQEDRQNTLQEQAHSLMQGPLKHIRAAALAAVLVPLASVAATPAEAQTTCGMSGGLCGFVWNDANKNGIQDAGESPIVNASVTLVVPPEMDSVPPTSTDANGYYYFAVPSGFTYEVLVSIPSQPGFITHLSTQDAVDGDPTTDDDTIDSDGKNDGAGNSGVLVYLESFENTTIDFGFYVTPSGAPGTGTPGYWKNHPEAWPDLSNGLKIGNVVFTKAQLLAALVDRSSKDKTVTMFSSLVPAILNGMVGNDSTCVAETIAKAQGWMSAYPFGSNVPASSPAWKLGEPWHRTLDNYNNGGLCAPHRD